MIPGRVYSLATIAQILRRRLWLLILLPIVGGGAAMGFAMTRPDIYAASTVVLAVPPRIPEAYVKSAFTEPLEYRLLSISPQILNPERLERIIVELDLYPELRKTVPMQQVIETMRRSIIGPSVVRPDAFSIGYFGFWPERVKQVTDRLGALFVEENIRHREKTATDTTDFLGSELEDTRRRLEEREREIQEYRTRNAGALPSQMAANLQVLKSTQDQAQVLQDTLSRDRERRSELEQLVIEAERRLEVPEDEPTDASAGANPDEPAQPAPDAAASGAAPADGTAPAGGTTATVDAANNPDMNFGAPGTSVVIRLENARRYLANLQLRLRPAHPEVVRATRMVEQLEAAVKEQTVKGPSRAISPLARARAEAAVNAARRRLATADKEIAAKTAELSRLQNNMALYQSRVESGPMHEARLVELTRDNEVLRASYQTLLAKKEESGIAANLARQQGSQQFKIIEQARLPTRPASPNRPMMGLAGLGIGLGLGLTLVVVLELRDQSFRSVPEVIDVLSLPVLATVPTISTNYERRRFRRRLALGAGMAVFVALVGGGLFALRNWW
jgi:uncharacterized protein involved in exopolysaccharide biosynthesis